MVPFSILESFFFLISAPFSWRWFVYLYIPWITWSPGLGQVNGTTESCNNAPWFRGYAASRDQVLSSLVPRQEQGKRGESRGSEFRELFILMWLFWWLLWMAILLYLHWQCIYSLSIGGYFQDVLRYNTYQLWDSMGMQCCRLRPRDARYPVLPYWLDGTELNGWDQQSQYFGRFGRLVGLMIRHLCWLVLPRQSWEITQTPFNTLCSGTATLLVLRQQKGKLLESLWENVGIPNLFEYFNQTNRAIKLATNRIMHSLGVGGIRVWGLSFHQMHWSVYCDFWEFWPGTGCREVLFSLAC